jgi:hypothetical protein
MRALPPTPIIAVQECPDRPALGLRSKALLNRGIVDNQHPQRRRICATNGRIQSRHTELHILNCAKLPLQLRQHRIRTFHELDGRVGRQHMTS